MLCKGVLTNGFQQYIKYGLIDIKNTSNDLFRYRCGALGEYEFPLEVGEYDIYVSNDKTADMYLLGHATVTADMVQKTLEELVENISTSTGGGSGINWITHKIELTYVDMLMSEDTLLENGLGYSSVKEAIKLIPYRSSIANNGKHYGGSGETLSTVPIQNNNIKAVYMGTNSDGKHIFRYAVENATGFPYGDEFTFYIKKAVKGNKDINTGYLSTSFYNTVNPIGGIYVSFTYEVTCRGNYYYNPLTLTYISSVSNEDGDNPFYTFTEKYIDDSEV